MCEVKGSGGAFVRISSALVSLKHPMMPQSVIGIFVCSMLLYFIL